jgi:hypothetical protein
MWTEEMIYESYWNYCRRVGVLPMPFDQWRYISGSLWSGAHSWSIKPV